MVYFAALFSWAFMQVNSSIIFLVLFIIGFGLSAGARGPIITTLMAEIFAGKGLASIYGATNLGQGIGAATGAILAGFLFDLTGGYNLVSFYAVYLHFVEPCYFGQFSNQICQSLNF